MEPDLSLMEAYFHKQGWMPLTDTLEKLEKPGEGNMNYVLRAVSSSGSFIVKQARPWVEKYPQFEAPMERLTVESRFLSIAGKIPGLAGAVPQVLAFDPVSNILALEDLGRGADYTYLYKKGELLSETELIQLANFLSLLHAWRPAAGEEPFPLNMHMRKDLNQVHIFHFPFQENNGLDLDAIQPGLKAAAQEYVSDTPLKARIAQLGERYVSTGPCLLQGDFYPGSWLKTPEGPRVIDPEFSFMGPPEFELGVMVAHLAMAEQGEQALFTLRKHYQQPAKFDEQLLAGFAGTEILRRLIGVAQLPVSLSLSEKIELMRRAAYWIRSGRLAE